MFESHIGSQRNKRRALTDPVLCSENWREEGTVMIAADYQGNKTEARNAKYYQAVVAVVVFAAGSPGGGLLLSFPSFFTHSPSLPSPPSLHVKTELIIAGERGRED